MARCAVLLLVALTACRPPRRPAPAPTPAPAPAVAMVVELAHVGPAKFNVTYTLPSPARALALGRRARGVRAHWLPGPGTRLVRASDHDFLVAAAPRSTFSVELPVDDVQPEMEYRAYYPFTDEGTLVYTGHLAATPAECADAACNEPRPPIADLAARLELVARAGETVLVRGRPRGPRVTIPTFDSDGTYAYFGSLPAIDTADVVGVIDRGMPPALRGKLDELLPKLFALLAAGLGGPGADEKPLLFATFTALPGDGRSLGGNVAGHRLLNFHFGLGAAAVARMSESLVNDIAILIAHEAVHLWNGDLYPASERAAPWLGEGSADALALRALRQLGVLDEAAYRERLSTALSLCLLELDEGAPLAVPARARRARAAYDCGSTIALLTEGSIAHTHATLFSFWREIFANAQRGYDETVYLETLGRKGDTKTMFFVRDLFAPQSEHGESLVANLERVGIHAEPATSLPAAYEAQSGPAAVRALLDPDCVGALSFRGNYAVSPRVTLDAACGALAKGDVVELLAGIDLATRGATAFDAAFAECAARGTVTMGPRARPTRVKCAEEPRSRPAYYQVTKAP